MNEDQIEKIESFLQNAIFPELEKGRPNWDKPHTSAVVHFYKQIIQNSPNIRVDFIVILIAAYAHDWGYAGLFHEGEPFTLNDVLSMKKLHM